MSKVSLFEDIQMPRDKMTHKNVSAPNTKVELRTKRRWSLRAIRLRLDTPAFRLRLRPSVKGELPVELRTLTTRPMLGASPTILVFELP